MRRSVAQGRREGPPSRARQRRQLRPLQARNLGRRAAPASAHRPAAHGGRRRRSAVLHDAIRRRRVAARAAHARGELPVTESVRDSARRRQGARRMRTRRASSTATSSPTTFSSPATSAAVTDFGVAKAVDRASTDDGASNAHVAGVALGTPAYMAPEQASADPTSTIAPTSTAFGVRRVRDARRLERRSPAGPRSRCWPRT